MSTFMPESYYKFSPMSMEDITSAYERHETVTGFVESIDVENEVLYVRLGSENLASMPFSEVTIYPFRYTKKDSSTLPTNIRCIIHKQIRVKITDINNEVITVSRKQNMQEAHNILLKKDKVSMYITNIIPKTVFGDIGEGINAKIFINEISRTHLKSSREFFKKGQAIDVILLGTDDEMRFIASYKRSFPPYRKEDYTVGMTIRGKVGDWIKICSTSAYYVSITPQVSGIMNIPQRMYLDYGCDVECIVNEATDKGLELAFSKVL